ncbi:MAG TPA: hypothetical protein EYG92_06045 [Lutibacter sp.]|nr:hypothetical protein [Lutibacter sp.]
MKKKKLLLLFLIITVNIFAQKSKKSLKVSFTKNPPKIDGILNDVAWMNTNKAIDFVMYEPGYGDAEPKDQRTFVKMLYDHEAIYVCATLFDSNPQDIPMQFTTRDNFGQSDSFTVSINPYNDAINDIRFHVMSTGTQADVKISNEGADTSWNAVWESAVSIDDKAWYVEMKIPYSALRFPSNSSDDWGINFYRNISQKEESYSWNFIDTKKGDKSDYSGLLTGIEDINPPLRLSLYPYAQGSFSIYDGDENWDGTAGLDLKYGINESFTLDVTLVPDFGQTEFDDLVLNLGPFEEQYEEKRAFFTEGTDLFSRGDLFYSRRIGSTPTIDISEELNENEVIESQPAKSKMLNATKLSGRTDSGLGIGFFNAITVAKTRILDTVTNNSRKVISDPYTNYNIFVLDQTFNDNSTMSLVNTNVLRQGNYTDANVTSALVDYRTNNNKYAFKTDLSVSNRFTSNGLDTGFEGKLKIKEIEGAHRFGVEIKLSDTKYNKDDLGIQDYNNFVRYEASYRYRTFKPFGNFNRVGVGVWSYLEYKYKPYTYADNGLGISAWAVTKNQVRYGTNLNAYLGYLNDYYEPETEGRFIKAKQLQYANFWFRSNYARKLALFTSLTGGAQLGETKPQKNINVILKPRYRFNNRFQIIYLFNWLLDTNKKGHVDDINETDIIFGNRKEKVLVNSLQSTYNISTKSSFALAFRHYWIQANYDNQLFLLEQNGSLSQITHTGDYNENVNYWNLDFNYSWEFAPGSQLVAQYKNAIYNDNGRSKLHFNENLSGLFNEPIKNQFSLKLIYYLDSNDFFKN